MGKRVFSREFKLEAVKLVLERGIARSEASRPRSARARTDEALLVHVRASFEQSHRAYGSPRVWRHLHDWGMHCSVHRIARLMRAVGLRGRSRDRRRPSDSAERDEALIAPIRLERQFQASRPNRRWVADFTYVPTGEGWLFVAAVLESVLAPDRRLVDECEHDRAARHGRIADGHLA